MNFCFCVFFELFLFFLKIISAYVEYAGGIFSLDIFSLVDIEREVSWVIS